jgi:type VI secretion system secreted protein Hcp
MSCAIVDGAAANLRSDTSEERSVALNAFLTFFDKADGESIQKGHEKWVELQGWDWEVEAESSWTKGGGASVGKPAPGSLSCVHAFDGSSIVALGYICTGGHSRRSSST